MVMTTLNQASGHRTPINYSRMITNTEKQDKKIESIESLAKLLYENMSDDDYLEIEDKIRMALGWESIDPDFVQNALKNICSDEAAFRINNSNECY